MKPLYLLILFTFLIFAGCSNVENITPPSQQKFSLIPIPPKASGVETQFTTSKDIDGSLGGIITFDKQYLSSLGSVITVHVDLTVPPSAFTGVKTITLTLDDQYAVINCDPSLQFAAPLILNYSYLGIPVKQVTLVTGNKGFYCIKSDETLEPVVCSQVVINRGLKKIAVEGAQINHFSRYGWATLDGQGD